MNNNYRIYLNSYTGADRSLDISEDTVNIIKSLTAEEFHNFYYKYSEYVKFSDANENLHKFSGSTLTNALYTLITNLDTFLDKEIAQVSNEEWRYTADHLIVFIRVISIKKETLSKFDTWLIKQSTKYQLVCKCSNSIILESEDEELIKTAYQNSLSIHPITKDLIFEPYLIVETRGPLNGI